MIGGFVTVAIPLTEEEHAELQLRARRRGSSIEVEAGKILKAALVQKVRARAAEATFRERIDKRSG